MKGGLLGELDQSCAGLISACVAMPNGVGFAFPQPRSATRSPGVGMGTPGGRRSGNCRWMHQCWRWSLVDASPIAVERLQRETRALPCRVSIAFARARTLATAVSGSIASSSWTPTPTPPLLANHRDRTLSLVNCLPTRTQSGTTGFRRKLLLHGENVPATRRTESRKRLNIFSTPNPFHYPASPSPKPHNLVPGFPSFPTSDTPSSKSSQPRPDPKCPSVPSSPNIIPPHPLPLPSLSPLRPPRQPTSARLQLTIDPNSNRQCRRVSLGHGRIVVVRRMGNIGGRSGLRRSRRARRRCSLILAR